MLKLLRGYDLNRVVEWVFFERRKNRPKNTLSRMVGMPLTREY
jgi:hypothetical protein